MKAFFSIKSRLGSTWSPIKIVNASSDETSSSITTLNSPSDNIEINSLDINNDCLTINYSASGCSGDTWELSLIDSETILESLPLQRRLILSLRNEEECEAFITRETSFDISGLQVEENEEVLLNIINAEQEFLYQY